MSSTRRLVIAIAMLTSALFAVARLVETQLSPSAAVAVGKVTSFFVPISGAIALTFAVLCFPTATRPYAMTASAITIIAALGYGLLGVLTGGPLIVAPFVFLFGFASVGVLAGLAAVLVGMVIWFVKRKR
jgi:hypothetical protein